MGLQVATNPGVGLASFNNAFRKLLIDEAISSVMGVFRSRIAEKEI